MSDKMTGPGSEDKDLRPAYAKFVKAIEEFMGETGYPSGFCITSWVLALHGIGFETDGSTTSLYAVETPMENAPAFHITMGLLEYAQQVVTARLHDEFDSGPIL